MHAIKETRAGFFVRLAEPFEQAVARVTAALKQEGFGILTDIDVQDTLRQKLGAEIPAYRILGACNPPLAHRALSAEPEVGLLLPCNVTVRAVEDGVEIGFLNPDVMQQVLENETVAEVAREARQRLQRVASALTAAPVEG